MKDVQELLKQKQMEFERLTQEIEALRLTMRLLEEVEAAKADNAIHSAASAFRNRSSSHAGPERGGRVIPIQAFENGHGSASEAGLQFP